ncbi:hypothetical protein F66182_8644 [Fusarium sp. NRRL 66182]|nr:hypothetical protein F66182_8644 [Fusarium sp. NRRL 66182]
MAQPRKTAAAGPLGDVPDPDGHPPIPPLASFTPAIFCPIGENDKLRDALSGPSFTKRDRLQAELDALNAHAITTRDNFLALCVRERERIFQEGRRFAALDEQSNSVTPDVPRGLQPKDLHDMIANMEAPPKPNHGNTPDIPRPVFDISKARSLRERQATQLMLFAESSADIAEKREAEITKRRGRIEAEIKKEQLRQDQEHRAS